MANLAPPFILCPISGRKDFLGMSSDCVANKVVITFSKNIAIRYNIREQSQETSWTSSKHWFTSKVVYCEDEGKYGAIIDYNVVALWNEDDTTLSQLTKHKLQEPIFGLKPTTELGTLVVFACGDVVPLRSVTETSRRLLVDTNKEKITNVDIDERNQLAFVTCCPVSKKGIDSISQLRVLVIPLSTLDAEATQATVTCDEHRIMGHCIVPRGDESSLLYLSSDGFLYKQMLLNPSLKASSNLAREKVVNLRKLVNTNLAIALRIMDDGNSIVCYGSEPSEEGATVFMYDIMYDLMITKQALKLYSIPPIMEKIGQFIIVPVGVHILAMKFQLTRQLLSSVVGKHQLRSGEEDIFVQREPWGMKEWGGESVSKSNRKELAMGEANEFDALKNAYPKFWEIVHNAKTLAKEGQPESVICDQVIPAILEKKCNDAVSWLLDFVTYNVPEDHLVSILMHFIRELKPKVHTDDSSQRVPFEPHCRIEEILQLPFDTLTLVKNLRLKRFEELHSLILYLTDMLEADWEFEETMEVKVKSWLNWASAVIDAHFTSFVLNNELVLTERMLKAINEKMKMMKDIGEFEAMLEIITNKNKSGETASRSKSTYRTEVVPLETVLEFTIKTESVE